MTDNFDMGDSAVESGIDSHERLRACLLAAREHGRPELILDFIPYSGFIGAKAKVDEGDVLYWLEPRRSNIGNPSLPALHGGVIAGFLELSASVELLFGLELNSMPKVVDFSLDYLRPGRLQTLYASCKVLRQGKQLVNVSITAWQVDIELPVATARCHFLIN